MHSLFPTEDSMATYVNFYKSKTLELIKSQSYQLHGARGTRVDIVRNVINIASVHWAADYLIGLPLKTKENPKGLFTEQEVNGMLSLLFSATLQDVQPETSWTLEHTALPVAQVIQNIIKENLKQVGPKVRLFHSSLARHTELTMQH